MFSIVPANPSQRHLVQLYLTKPRKPNQTNKSPYGISSAQGAAPSPQCLCSTPPSLWLPAPKNITYNSFSSSSHSPQPPSQCEWRGRQAHHGDRGRRLRAPAAKAPPSLPGLDSPWILEGLFISECCRKNMNLSWTSPPSSLYKITHPWSRSRPTCASLPAIAARWRIVIPPTLRELTWHCDQDCRHLDFVVV